MPDVIGRVLAVLLLVGWAACAVKVVCDAALDFDKRHALTDRDGQGANELPQPDRIGPESS